MAENHYLLDYGVLVVELNSAPVDSFYTALRARGWTQHENQFRRGTHVLEYDAAGQCLVIKPIQYLKKRQ